MTFNRTGATEKANRKMDALIAEAYAPRPDQVCGRCLTTYVAEDAECPYCLTPAGEAPDDEDF